MFSRKSNDSLKVYCPACGTTSDAKILDDVIAPDPNFPLIQCPHCKTKYAVTFLEVVDDGDDN